MNWQPTGEPTSPNLLDFIEHSSFIKEAAHLRGRFSSFDLGYNAAKKILSVHFHPLDPRPVIAPGKLHRIKDCDNFTVWKLEMAVQGLRTNQFPRVWFALQGRYIAFLAIATHVDNYDDGARDNDAESRAHDLL